MAELVRILSFEEVAHQATEILVRQGVPIGIARQRSQLVADRGSRFRNVRVRWTQRGETAAMVMRAAQPGRQHQDPFHAQTEVQFVGEAHRAEHLDALTHHQDRGIPASRFGTARRGGAGIRIVAPIRDLDRVGEHRARDFKLAAAVHRAMLQRLEAADRRSELLTCPQVLQRHIEGQPGHRQKLGGRQDRRDVERAGNRIRSANDTMPMRNTDRFQCHGPRECSVREPVQTKGHPVRVFGHPPKLRSFASGRGNEEAVRPGGAGDKAFGPGQNAVVAPRRTRARIDAVGVLLPGDGDQALTREDRGDQRVANVAVVGGCKQQQRHHGRRGEWFGKQPGRQPTGDGGGFRDTETQAAIVLGQQHAEPAGIRHRPPKCARVAGKLAALLPDPAEAGMLFNKTANTVANGLFRAVSGRILRHCVRHRLLPSRPARSWLRSEKSAAAPLDCPTVAWRLHRWQSYR